MNKPNGQTPPRDPALQVPATFINDFRFSMNDQFTRLTYLESQDGQAVIRGVIVVPTAVLAELAELVLKTKSQGEARAKLVIPTGANQP